MATYRGALTGRGMRIALVVSRFNETVTSALCHEAQGELERLGVSADDIDVYEVPGAFELPAVAQRVARQGRHHAVICLGAVIRGETPHFEYVSSQTAHGIARTAMAASCPVLFGVLTTDTEEQARARAGGSANNKGVECAQAALELADLYRQLG